MTNDPAPCKSGDVNDTRTVTIGGVESLTGATAVAHIQHVNTGEKADLTASVTNAAEREIEVKLGETEGWLPNRPELGKWYLEVEVTFGDGSVLTFPSGSRHSSREYDVLEVFEDLDAPDAT